jgi:hypothetical protein
MLAFLISLTRREEWTMKKLNVAVVVGIVMVTTTAQLHSQVNGVARYTGEQRSAWSDLSTWGGIMAFVTSEDKLGQDLAACLSNGIFAL